MSLPHPLPETLLRESAWLRTLARRLTGDAGLAEDLQQDVVVAALAQPVQASSGRSWFAGVARNLAAMLRRSAVREQQRLRRLPVREPAPSPDALAAEAELQQKAVAAVLALPQVYRDTVLLRFMQGLSLRATAQAMGVPEETVRTRQKRALAMLRTQLAPEDRQRRSLAAFLGGLAAWGVAMKSKHTVAVAVAALFTLLLVIPFWPGQQAGGPPAQPAAIMPVQTKADDRGGEQGTGAAGLATARTEVPIAAPPPTMASLTMRLTWLDDRTPVVGVAVRCRHSADAGVVASTDERGEATFSGLEPGEYEAGTYDWRTEKATLTAGRHAVVEHAMSRGRSATGMVLDHSGLPVAGATILVSAAAIIPQWIFPAGLSDSDGRFRCQGVLNGGLVGASHERHGTSEFRMLIGDSGAEAPEDVVLRLPAATVTVQGRVVEDGGTAVCGAWVQFGSYAGRWRRDDQGRHWQPAPAVIATSDTAGNFLVSGLPAGECPVLIYRRGLAPFREKVVLAPGMASMLVTLHPGGVVTGCIHDARGNAMAGVDINPEDFAFPSLCSQQSAADGTFRFEDLGPGELTLEARARDLPRQRRTFLVAGTQTQYWDVVLQLEQAIRGRLVDQRGEALVGWYVHLPGTSRHSKTDAAGRFVIAECASTDNTLAVRSQNPFTPVRARYPGVRAIEEEQTFTVPAESAPSARVAGQCLGPDGAPIAGARIQTYQDDLVVDIEGTPSQAEGGFTVGPLPPGRYVLLPYHWQVVFAPIPVDLKADETRELGQLRAERPARLTVRLLGDPAVCKEAEVRLGRDGGTRDETGRERVFRLFPGRHQVVIRRNEVQQDAFEIELAAGADVAREVSVR